MDALVLLVTLAPWTFGVGNLAFFAALLPTVRDPEARVPRFTSLLTGSWLAAFSVTFIAMGLAGDRMEWLLSGGIQTCTALTWFYIAIRRSG